MLLNPLIILEVYKTTLISTIVDLHSPAVVSRVYKTTLISTIVDFSMLNNLLFCL